MSDLARTNGQLDPMTVAQVFRASGMFPDIHSEAAAAAKFISSSTRHRAPWWW